MGFHKWLVIFGYNHRDMLKSMLGTIPEIEYSRWRFAGNNILSVNPCIYINIYIYRVSSWFHTRKSSCCLKIHFIVWCWNILSVCFAWEMPWKRCPATLLPFNSSAWPTTKKSVSRKFCMHNGFYDWQCTQYLYRNKPIDHTSCCMA